MADGFDGVSQLRFRCDVVRAGVDFVVVEVFQHASAHGIDLSNRFDLVAEELDADGALMFVGGKNLDDVATDAERAAVEVDIVALVLDVDESSQQVVTPELGVLLDGDEQTGVALRGADAVDAAHRSDDDDVAPGEKRSGGGVPHPVNLVIDDRVLLDEGIGDRDVGFGLVVVVVGDEVLDGVVREQLTHLAVELSRQRLVGRHDQGGAIDLGDDVGHSERLAAAGDTEQGRETFAVLKSLANRVDGLRLVAFRHERGGEYELR